MATHKTTEEWWYARDSDGTRNLCKEKMYNLCEGRKVWCGSPAHDHAQNGADKIIGPGVHGLRKGKQIKIRVTTTRTIEEVGE